MVSWAAFVLGNKRNLLIPHFEVFFRNYLLLVLLINQSFILVLRESGSGVGRFYVDSTMSKFPLAKPRSCLGLLRCCHPTLEYGGTMAPRTVGGRLSSDAPLYARRIKSSSTLLRKRKTRRLMWTLDEFLVGYSLSKSYLCRRVCSDIVCPLCHIVMFVLFALRLTGWRLCVRE